MRVTGHKIKTVKNKACKMPKPVDVGDDRRTRIQSLRTSHERNGTEVEDCVEDVNVSKPQRLFLRGPNATQLNTNANNVEPVFNPAPHLRVMFYFSC